jgi:hypothetical protein
VAGDGTQGFSGDGGSATSAELNFPARPALDAAGNLVLADSGNQRIRVIAESTGTFYRQAMTAGHIYTVAGTGTEGFAGDGGPATSAEFQNPVGTEIDGAGNVVIGDANNNRVRVIADSTGTFYGKAMTAGDIYTVAGNGSLTFSGAAAPATTAELDLPDGVTVDGAGNRLITDEGNDRIRVVAAADGTFYGRAMTAGHIYVVAGDGTQGFSGDGGPATSAELNDPAGTAADAAGNLVLSDALNFRVRVVAARTGTFYGKAMTAGDIYTVAGDGVRGFSGDGGPATGAELGVLGKTTIDAAGNLVIADASNNRIRVVADSTGTFYGQAMTAGDIYTVAGRALAGFSGDGGPATAAKLSDPVRAAVDASRNLVIADASNNRIRVVADSTGTFYGRAMTAGDIYTVAGGGTGGLGDGGGARRAELDFPLDVASDAAGNLVIADARDNRVRVVADSTGTFYGKPMTKGDIYTVAGNGTAGFAGDGGPATKAELWNPEAVAVDRAGTLLIADSLNDRIRAVG